MHIHSEGELTYFINDATEEHLCAEQREVCVFFFLRLSFRGSVCVWDRIEESAPAVGAPPAESV